MGFFIVRTDRKAIVGLCLCLYKVECAVFDDGTCTAVTNTRVETTDSLSVQVKCHTCKNDVIACTTCMIRKVDVGQQHNRLTTLGGFCCSLEACVLGVTNLGYRRELGNILGVTVHSYRDVAIFPVNNVGNHPKGTGANGASIRLTCFFNSIGDLISIFRIDRQVVPGITRGSILFRQPDANVQLEKLTSFVVLLFF